MKLLNTTTLKNSQDSEAAEFWEALVHHIASIVDHKMTTPKDSAKDFADVLLNEMREVDITGNAKFARFELKLFLTRCFKMEPTSRLHIVPPRGEYCTLNCFLAFLQFHVRNDDLIQAFFYVFLTQGSLPLLL